MGKLTLVAMGDYFIDRKRRDCLLSKDSANLSPEENRELYHLLALEGALAKADGEAIFLRAIRSIQVELEVNEIKIITSQL